MEMSPVPVTITEPYELVTQGDLGDELLSCTRAMRAINVSGTTILASGGAVRQFGTWMMDDGRTTVADIQPRDVDNGINPLPKVNLRLPARRSEQDGGRLSSRAYRHAVVRHWCCHEPPCSPADGRGGTTGDRSRVLWVRAPSEAFLHHQRASRMHRRRPPSLTHDGQGSSLISQTGRGLIPGEAGAADRRPAHTRDAQAAARSVDVDQHVERTLLEDAPAYEGVIYRLTV